METLKEFWGFVRDEPFMFLLLLLMVAAIVGAGWAQWDDYRDCVKDGHPGYLCRGLLK